ALFPSCCLRDLTRRRFRCCRWRKLCHPDPCLVMCALVVDRRSVTQTRVTTMRVVPALDPLEDRHPGFGLAFEPPTVKHLAFERGEEALGHRVVVGIAHRAHRRHDAGFPAALTESIAR